MTGCDPSSSVAVSINGSPVGQTAANPSGVAELTLETTNVPVGRHEVRAVCGPVALAALDVVLNTHSNSATSTLVTIVLVLLMGIVVYRRRLFPVGR